MYINLSKTDDSSKVFNLSSVFTPFFGLMSTSSFLTLVLRRSFSTRTLPMKPVAPVMKTVLSL